MKKAYINQTLKPGCEFEYSSANVDVFSWIISRLSRKAYHDFIRENIWAKIGAEHDAFITVDRSYTGVATLGINTTLLEILRPLTTFFRDGVIIKN